MKKTMFLALATLLLLSAIVIPAHSANNPIQITSDDPLPTPMPPRY